MKSLASRTAWWITLLFFLSGATGLAYEIIWFKRFAHIWGSSSLAIATVVASFLVGLGLGAYLIGRWADRLALPLRWYGASELAIGALAALVPWELKLLSVLGGSVETTLPDSDLVRFALRFALTFVVIGPPCALMGGTLPLLIRQCTVRSLSDATGWLYGVNTLGAALGCYLAGFHLLPAWGLFWTNNLAAAVNLAIGAVALVAARGVATGGVAPPLASRATPRTAPSQDPRRSPLAGMTIPLAAAITGCAALVLQMTWARQLAVTVGGSTYSFTATLFIVLLGIAAGGLLYHLWLRRYEAQHHVAAAVIFLLAAATVAGQQRIPWLCEQAGAHREARVDLLGNAAVCVLASAVLELIPSIGAGVLFPLLVQVTRQSPVVVGRVVGNVYAWNTLGSLLGATLTARFLFPTIGAAGAVALALALYAAAILLLLPPARTIAVRFPLGATLATGVCVLLAAWRHDPRLTDFGMYLYGYSSTDYRLNCHTVLFEEGRASNVLVLDIGGSRALRVNGKVDASTSRDMMTQLGLGYFPRLFHPRAEEVLVIGYGSGATVGTSLLFPDTKVVCCEIEPAVFKASPLFAGINHSPEKSPRLRMEFDDGRSYLQRTDRRFDLIISEPSNPWIAGVSNLFTREFFQLARDRLRPGGALAQWIQTYNFGLEEYALIVHTLQSVFPHCGLVHVTGGDTILLASARPLDADPHAVASFQCFVDATPQIQADLKKFFGVNQATELLLQYYGPDEQGLAEFVARGGSPQWNTDINMRLEFDAPLRLFGRNPAEAEMLPTALVALRDQAWLERLAQKMGIQRDTALYHWMLGNQALAEKRTSDATPLLRRAIAQDPSLAVAYRDLAEASIANHDDATAIDAMTSLLPLTPDDAEVRASLAGLLARKKEYRRATELLRESLRLDSSSVIVQMNLAWVLATAPDPDIRDGSQAVALGEQACAATNYQDAYCLDALAAALAEAGDFERAIHLASEAARQLRLLGEPTHMVEQRLALYYRRQAYHEE